MAEIEPLLDAYSYCLPVAMRCAWEAEGLKPVRRSTYRHNLDDETLLCTSRPSFLVAQLAEPLICLRCRSRRVVVSFSFPVEPLPQVAEGRAAHLKGC